MDISKNSNLFPDEKSGQAVTTNLKNPRFGRWYNEPAELFSAPHLQVVNYGFSNCANLDLEVFEMPLYY